MDQINFFEQMCTLVVFRLLPDHVKIETFGKRFYINPENRTLVSPEFFVRFTDGSIVTFVWDDTRNVLNIAVAFDGGSEADTAFDVPFKNTMLSAMAPAVFANIHASFLSNPSSFSWDEGTWCSELHDVILEILDLAEVDELAELFDKNSKNGATSNGC